MSSELNWPWKSAQKWSDCRLPDTKVIFKLKVNWRHITYEKTGSPHIPTLRNVVNPSFLYAQYIKRLIYLLVQLLNWLTGLPPVESHPRLTPWPGGLRPRGSRKRTYLAHITKATKSMYLNIVEKQAQMMLNILSVPYTTVTVVWNMDQLFLKPHN